MEEEVEAFLSNTAENSLPGNDDTGFPNTRSVSSHMSKLISTCKVKDDIAVIEERVKANPTLCNAAHVVQLAKHRRWNCIMTLADALLNHTNSAFSCHFQQILNYTVDTDRKEEGPSDDFSVNNTKKERHDTCIIIIYNILAMQKMKRYADLKEYLQSLFHSTSGDHVQSDDYQYSQLPPWVPLSLQVYAFCLMHYSSETTLDRSKISSQLKHDMSSMSPPHSASLDLAHKLHRWKDSLDLYKSSSTSDSTSQIMQQHASIFSTTLFSCILSDCFIRQNDIRQALKCLDDALTSILPIGDQELLHLPDKEKTVKDIFIVSFLAHRIELVSCQGRILVECGALDCADALYKQAKEDYEYMVNLVSSTQVGASGDTSVKPNRITLLLDNSVDKDIALLFTRASYRLVFNNALLYFGRGMYDSAQDEFLKALEIQVAIYTHALSESSSCSWIVHNRLVPLSKEQDTQNACLNMNQHLWYTYESVYDHISACCINLSLCALYSGRMRDAIHILESMMRQDPTIFMTECGIFNLCTLYELGYDPAYNERKKTILWSAATKLQLDDLTDRETFRLQ